MALTKSDLKKYKAFTAERKRRALGWAIAYNGEIEIHSVAATKRAAQVRWSIHQGCDAPFHELTDAEVNSIWEANNPPGGALVPVDVRRSNHQTQSFIFQSGKRPELRDKPIPSFVRKGK